MKRARSWCAALVVAGLVAGACSSGDDEPDATDPPAVDDTTPDDTVPDDPTTDDTMTDHTAPDDTATDGPGRPQELRSDVDRVTPSADAPIDELVAGTNGAGFALQQQLGVGDENVVYSPASLAIAFAMAGAGADDATARQLADVFGFPSGDAAHEAMNALLRELVPNNRNHPNEGAETELAVANSGWAQAGEEIGSDYLDTLAAHYDAGLFTTDFAGDTEGSRQAINAWIDEQTRGLIPELIGEGALSPDTIYTLVNALYFKAAWTSEFDEDATEPDTFTRADGSKVDVPMMHARDRDASYIAGDDLTAVVLPYGDGEFRMKIVMPRQLGRFIGTLDAQRWSQLDSAFDHGKTNLTIPKWTTESTLDLNEPLSAMGLEIPGGSYPGIAPQMSVSSVLQGATITVDEKGTEAAAATTIMMATAAPADPEQPVDITIDRPFFYTIEHAPTGLVLFAGQVVDPSS